MFRGIKLRQSQIVIFCTSFIAGLLSILHLVIGYAKTPADSIYLWIPHYYLDYFVFVGGIAQGMRGNWFFENPYSVKDSSKTIMAWWQYIFYGKFASFFHLSPMIVYAVTIFLLSFISIWLMYFIIRRILSDSHFLIQLAALIFSLSAGPFFKLSNVKGSFPIIPFNFWQSPATFFDRFDPIPHHLLGMVFSLVLILLVGKTLDKIEDISLGQALLTAVLQAFIIIFMLTFSPFQALIFLIALIVIGLLHIFRLKFQGLLYIFIILFLVVPAAVLLKMHHQQIPMLLLSSRADQGYQLHPSLKDILLTTGPILVFVPFGLWLYFKKLSPTRWLLFLFVVSSYFLFSTNLAYYLGSHNLRFLTPLSYLFFGVLSLLGMIQIGRLLPKMGKWIVFPGAIIILLLFLPANILTFYVRLIDKNIFTETVYLKKNIVEGFQFIDSVKDNKAVLTTPSVFMGAILPIFVDKKVYLGRHSFTPDYEERQTTVSHFYNGWIKAQEAEAILNRNNIGYIILTSMEGFKIDPLLRYPFLQEVY